MRKRRRLGDALERAFNANLDVGNERIRRIFGISKFDCTLEL